MSPPAVVEKARQHTLLALSADATVELACSAAGIVALAAGTGVVCVCVPLLLQPFFHHSESWPSRPPPLQKHLSAVCLRHLQFRFEHTMLLLPCLKVCMIKACMDFAGAIANVLWSRSACIVNCTITSADVVSFIKDLVTGAQELGIDLMMYALNFLLVMLAPWSFALAHTIHNAWKWALMLDPLMYLIK
ncbi:hypothetical protein C0995_015902, partial [Termitomyces sp. Mi166